MVVHIVRKPNNVLLIVPSRGFCSDCLLTAEFVEEVDNHFDTFNGGTCVDQWKTLHCPLKDNSPHIDHWTMVSMRINSCIFLKNGKATFLHPPSLQIGWLN
jgi:hypothetical protein